MDRRGLQPPQRDFLLQVLEVFRRLDIAINRAYCLTISSGIAIPTTANRMWKASDIAIWARAARASSTMPRLNGTTRRRAARQDVAGLYSTAAGC